MFEKELKFKVVPNADSVAFVIQMLRYAEKHYPEIALGVALEFFGCLRSSEVYNLTTEQVRLHKSKGLITIILNANQAKEIIPNDELFIICEKHLSDKNANSTDTDKTCGALFLDKNQSPMNANTYRKTLKRLKEEFVTTIENEFPLQAEILKNNALRSIMLNMLDTTGLRSEEIRNVRICRADSLLVGALKYYNVTAKQ